MTLASTAYGNYKNQAIQTLTPGELIILLYEEASLRISRAILHIKNKRIEDAHKNIIKAENIIAYLTEILDINYPIADEILPLYEFITKRLVEANLSKDISLLEDAKDIINQMKDMWKEADLINRQKTVMGGK